MPYRFLDRLAYQLRVFRTENQLSQEEAAHQIGCSIPTYRLLEQPHSSQSRTADPKLSTIMSALSAIGIDKALIEALGTDLQLQLPEPCEFCGAPKGMPVAGLVAEG